MNVTLHTDG